MVLVLLIQVLEGYQGLEMIEHQEERTLTKYSFSYNSIVHMILVPSILLWNGLQVSKASLNGQSLISGMYVKEEHSLARNL